MEAQFYVYLYVREDRTPYYVGKGSGNRWSENYGRPCQRPKDRTRIIVKECFSESEAYATEKHLILLYGRKDLGTGCLHNRSEGGEGADKGVPWTPARRAAYQQGEGKRRWSTRSRTFSDEHRKNLKHSRPWSAVRRAAYEARKLNG